MRVYNRTGRYRNLLVVLDRQISGPPSASPAASPSYYRPRRHLHEIFIDHERQPKLRAILAIKSEREDRSLPWRHYRALSTGGKTAPRRTSGQVKAVTEAKRGGALARARKVFLEQIGAPAPRASAPTRGRWRSTRTYLALDALAKLRRWIRRSTLAVQAMIRSAQQAATRSHAEQWMRAGRLLRRSWRSLRCHRTFKSA